MLVWRKHNSFFFFFYIFFTFCVSHHLKNVQLAEWYWMFLASRTENTVCNWWFVLRPQETACRYPLMSTLLAVCHLKKKRWWSRKPHHPQSAILSLHQTNTELSLCTKHHFHYLCSLFFPASLKPARIRKNELNPQWAHSVLGAGRLLLLPMVAGSRLDPIQCRRGNNCPGTSIGIYGAICPSLCGEKVVEKTGRDTDPRSQLECIGSMATISSLQNRHLWLQQRCK